MPMTLRQIAQFTPRDRLVLARDVRVVSMKVGFNKALGRKVAIATTYSQHDPNTGLPVAKPPKYRTEIVALDDATKGFDRQYVQVSCSCPDFWSVWEYALAKKGAAVIRYSNGDSPDTRNPRYVPGTCKHCIALMNQVKGR